MHPSTFDYMTPTDQQIRDMESLRMAATGYAESIADLVPEGPDKTYILRKLREVAMWVNVAVTRGPDGTPRQG